MKPASSLAVWATALSSLAAPLVPSAEAPPSGVPWEIVVWCEAGVRLEVPTHGRELVVELGERSGRIQSFRVEELQPAGDGFYEMRPGDYFLELLAHPAAGAPPFPTTDCAASPTSLEGVADSLWCRLGTEPQGEESLTHLAHLPAGSARLELRIDGSQLAQGEVLGIFGSVDVLSEPCGDGG